VLITNTITYV